MGLTHPPPVPPHTQVLLPLRYFHCSCSIIFVGYNWSENTAIFQSEVMNSFQVRPPH